MAVDLARERLFVAELGNGSLGVVDLEKGEVLKRVGGLKEPQGVAYVPGADLLYVASGGDGTLRRYAGADLGPARGRRASATTPTTSASTRAAAGWWSATATAPWRWSTPPRGRRRARSRCPATRSCSGWRRAAPRAFVNVPEARQVVVVDREAGRQVAAWKLDGRDNFPMALDEAGGRLLVVDRHPAELLVLDTASGEVVARLPTCGDADDVFWDAKRERVYVSCGEGVVDVVGRRGDAYQELARVPTAPGARTSLFVPELDRLYVAARAADGRGAAVLVMRPGP